MPEQAAYKRNIYVAITVIFAGAMVGLIYRPENTAAIIGFGTLIITQLFSQLKNSADVAEVKTALVQADTRHDEKLAEIHATGEKTLILVNSNMRGKLREVAELTARMYEKTKDPTDRVAMEVAKGLLREHDDKQTLIDDQKANGSMK